MPPPWVYLPPQRRAPEDRSPVSLEVDATSDLQALSGAVGARVRVLSTRAIFVCEHASPGDLPPDGLISVRARTPGCVWRLEVGS